MAWRPRGRLSAAARQATSSTANAIEYAGTFVEAVIAAGWNTATQTASVTEAATPAVAAAATSTCRDVQPSHADRHVATVAQPPSSRPKAAANSVSDGTSPAAAAVMPAAAASPARAVTSTFLP